MGEYADMSGEGIWTPKRNPYGTALASGTCMPVPYNEVYRLECVRAHSLINKTFEEQYENVVHLAMRIFQAEVSFVHSEGMCLTRKAMILLLLSILHGR
jgi:hypothetical protein